MVTLKDQTQVMWLSKSYTFKTKHDRHKLLAIDVLVYYLWEVISELSDGNVRFEPWWPRKVKHSSYTLQQLYFKAMHERHLMGHLWSNVSELSFPIVMSELTFGDLERSFQVIWFS